MEKYRVVVVGGGIVGCSVAYHLTKLGCRDVLLLERRAISCGTTWHAAGLVGQIKSTPSLTRLALYGADLYGRLEKETGQATGFRRPGSLTVARTPGRLVEIQRLCSMAHCFGIEAEMLTAKAAGEKWPLMRTDDLLGALWVPHDARTDPVDTAQALVRGARNGGAHVREGVTVTALNVTNGRVSGVVTDKGDIACEVVVNCGGMWAREIGGLAGVAVPVHASEHFYIVTEPLPGVTPGLPTLRDPDGYIYARDEVGGLLMGGFEPVAKPWGMKGIPDDFSFSLLPEDWDQFQVMMENAIVRIPAMETAPVRRHVNGPESFTPDGRFILGEAPGVNGFFVGAGFNSTGIGSAAGAGKALAEWIIEGHPSESLWEVDIRRFAGFEVNARYLHDRTVEVVGAHYDVHWPFRQPETARPVRCSPLHARVAAERACFGVAAGWERANWYAPVGVAPRYVYTFGRPKWFPYAAAEHRAVRENVGLFDQSSFSKFTVQGRDAEHVLQRLCANNVAQPVGKVVYTAMLNERGGVECDLTVTRVADDAYFVVTGTSVQTHDFQWIKTHIDSGAHAFVTDVTSAYATLGLMGPQAREVLRQVTDADLSNAAFPFGTAREIHVGYAPVRALRITYVGELGWELYVPSEFATGVFDALVGEGSRFGLRLAGYHALDSLRMEKAYRGWGSDITGDDTPLEAGLGFAVAFDTKTDFIGREALLKQRANPLRRRLVVFTLDDGEPVLFGGESFYRDGVLMGRLTSAAYGHTVGRAVGMGYVQHETGIDKAYLENGAFEVEIATERHRASARLSPPYDPGGTRTRM